MFTLILLSGCIVIFVAGMLLIEISTKQTYFKTMFGWSMLLVSCTLFVNKAMTILGAANTNDVFILSIMLSVIISMITTRLISK